MLFSGENYNLWYTRVMKIIGIVGTLAAGKGTLVGYLKDKYAFNHYSASGLLRKIGESRGMEMDRDMYSLVANELRAKQTGGVPQEVYETQVKSEQPERAVIEALHSPKEAEYIKSIGGVVLGIDADTSVRYERTLTRGSEKDNVTYEEFLRHIEREENDPNGHYIRGALNLADYTLQNNGSLDDLHGQIDSIMDKILSDSNN